MAANLERLAQEAEAKGYKTWAARWRTEAQLFREAGGPETFIQPAVEGQPVPSYQGNNTDLAIFSEYYKTTEREALSKFFGKDVEVPELPAKLLNDFERLAALGVRGFNPHFLPQVSLSLKEADKLPGWKVKPEAWFWQILKDRQIPQDAATLNQGWYLVDSTSKPDYNNGRQRYNDGFLEKLIGDLRRQRKVEPYQGIPADSRFGVSPQEIERVILPEFARQTSVEGLVRNKRYIEFNMLGNIHYPNWGQTITWESFADKFGDSGRLVGGYSGNGGLANVRYSWSGYRDDDTAFGPVVEYPSSK